MKSKKGVIITGIILVIITVASFSVWQIPDNSKMTIVVTDFESHLDGIDARHEIIIDAVDTSLVKMTNGDITPEELISITEVSASQINSQIIELVENLTYSIDFCCNLSIFSKMFSISSFVEPLICKFANAMTSRIYELELRNDSK